MYKIFIKAIFSTFLVVILLTNLLFFTNALHNFGVGLATDYQDKYFGFSTLYDFFTHGFTGDSGYLLNYQDFLNKLLKGCQTALYGNWESLFHFPSDSGFLNTLRGIGYTLASIGSIFGFAFYAILLVIYEISQVTWIILKFFSIIFGQWYSYIPLNPYLTTPVS